VVGGGELVLEWLVSKIEGNSFNSYVGMKGATKFKIVYSLWSGIPIVAGVFYVCRDIGRPYNKLFGLDATIGLAYLQIGILNLLNALYGSCKAGIRFAAVGVNVLSISLIVWVIHLFSADHRNFLLLGTMTGMVLFSLFVKRSS
jgi:hypothetical protein